MKQHGNIFIVSVLLAVTLVVSALLSFTEDPVGKESAEPEAIVTDISAGSVQAVVLKNETGSIGLLNLADGVLVEGADAAGYSQSKLITLIYTLSHLTAERTVNGTDTVNAAQAADTADEGSALNGTVDRYGLKKPQAQVSLLLKEDTIRLLLGRKSPISEEYYLQVEGNPQIYMIDGETAGLMLQSTLDLRDLSMYPAITGETLKALNQIVITNPEGRMVLQQIQSDTISSFFGMIEPVTAVLDWENVDTAVVNPLRELIPKRFVSDDVPLSDYGLDAPEYTLELNFGGQKYLCGFARKNPDSWYCANLAGTLVSEVDASAVQFLQTDFMELIGDSIYTVSAADVSRLSAKFENTMVALDMSGASTSLTAAIDDRQMDYLEVTEFFDKIDSIPAAAVLDGTETVTSSPVLTLTVSLRNGGEDMIEFYSISERQCAVYVNGAAEFSTYTTVVSDITAAFRKLDEE